MRTPMRRTAGLNSKSWKTVPNSAFASRKS